MINEITTKHGHIIKEGDIVRYDSEYWYVDAIVGNLMVICTVKNFEKGYKKKNVFITDAEIDKVFLASADNRKIKFLKAVYPLYAERLNIEHYGADKVFLKPGDFVCYDTGLFFSAERRCNSIILKQSKLAQKSIIACLNADGTLKEINLVNDYDLFKISVSDADAKTLRSVAAKFHIDV